MASLNIIKEEVLITNSKLEIFKFLSSIFGIFQSFWICTENCNISIAAVDFLMKFCLGVLKIIRRVSGMFEIFLVA
jgi:hypothetical protein